MWRGIFISSARKSVALKKIKISWHHCAAWIYEQVVNWHFDEIVTPSEINPFLEFSIFSKICLRRCQPSNWTFCDRHGMTHRHGPSNASSTMGRPRQRNPTTAEDRREERCSKIWVRVWSPGSKLVVSREVAKNPSVRTNHVTVTPLATWLLRTCQHRSSPVSILHTTSMCESLPAMTSWDVRVGRLIGGHGSSMNIHGGLRAFCRSKSTDTVGPVEVNPWMANLDALGVGRNPSASHRILMDFDQNRLI